MKTKSFIRGIGVACVLVLGASEASAGLYYSSGAPTIPDGSSVGIASTINVSGAGTILSSGDNVTLTLNVSGGNMGDLYAYLSFNRTTMQLLNRPGIGGNLSSLGYTGGSLNVMLSDGSYTSVNSYGGGAGTGTYNASAGNTAFQTYNAMSADGSWTLYFADLSGGDGANTSTLNGWSLDITAVPEPVNLALGVFGFLVLGFITVRGYGTWNIRHFGRRA